eukprot:6931148-Prymnesium_polylepis.1
MVSRAKGTPNSNLDHRRGCARCDRHADPAVLVDADGTRHNVDALVPHRRAVAERHPLRPARLLFRHLTAFECRDCAQCLDLVAEHALPILQVLHDHHSVHEFAAGASADRRHLGDRAVDKVERLRERRAVARGDPFAELLVACRVRRIDAPAAINGEVELHDAVTTDGAVVHVDELRERLDRRVGLPEPLVGRLERAVAALWAEICRNVGRLSSGARARAGAA